MNGQAGAVRSMFDFYVTRARTQIQSEFQYRAATYFWMIGMLAEPIVYLVVWTTIAEQHGGSTLKNASVAPMVEANEITMTPVARPKIAPPANVRIAAPGSDAAVTAT